MIGPPADLNALGIVREEQAPPARYVSPSTADCMPNCGFNALALFFFIYTMFGSNRNG
jgi:hypothetical protein